MEGSGNGLDMMDEIAASVFEQALCFVGAIRLELSIPCPAGSRLRDKGQFNETCAARRVVDTLDCLPVIPRFCPKDAGHEGLRIAVVEGEPARLNLHHDPVPVQEDVVRRGKGEAIAQRFVGGYGLGRLEALAVPAAEYVGRHHQLITAHFRLTGHLVGIDIDAAFAELFKDFIMGYGFSNHCLYPFIIAV
jgi:hypothetical protein